MPRTAPFDRHSKQYEDWFEANLFAYRSELRAVKYFVPRQGKGIEIGVGSGRFAAPLGIKYGVEPSAAMRRLAEKRGIDVYDAVAERLPFKSGYFDFALMVTTICFVDDAAASFREVTRVLRPRGVFIVGFVDRNSPLGVEYEKRKNNNVFYRDATFYSVEDVLDLYEKAGLENAEVVQTVFGKLPNVDAIQDFKAGHGEGGFVVARARKRKPDIH